MVGIITGPLSRLCLNWKLENATALRLRVSLWGMQSSSWQVQLQKIQPIQLPLSRNTAQPLSINIPAPGFMRLTKARLRLEIIVVLNWP